MSTLATEAIVSTIPAGLSNILSIIGHPNRSEPITNEACGQPTNPSGATVYIADVDAEDRWPRWRAQVAEGKIRSVLHVPMRSGPQVIGVLSLYTLHPDAFTPDDVAVAHILARHASVAVATARHEETLARAVDARKLVGQAMGILMERFDLSDDQAFALLRRYSQDTNTKLRDVAQELIDTRQLPSARVTEPGLDH
ncbi:GAF and ANTAR domain-containing protein [Kribbella sp. NPDC006257]|uniref:GAF and ANTAR domain-containing protein n=1 Tax=Kribbella sp. NPDC006257 TaxID=3156738 RepID=UPI0033A1F000